MRTYEITPARGREGQVKTEVECAKYLEHGHEGRWLTFTDGQNNAIYTVRTDWVSAIALKED